MSRLPALPRCENDTDEPVFAAPWQAQAFALAVELHRAGHFSRSEWADALGAEIAADGDDALAGPSASDAGVANERYYRCWLNALETLIARKRLV